MRVHRAPRERAAGRRAAARARRTWRRPWRVEACGRGKRVRFYRVTELVTQLLEAREERQLAPAEVAAGEAGPAGPGRAGVRAGEQGRGGAAVRRDQHGVRADERDRDDEPAVRGVDGGAGERAADGGDAGPADAPLHDPGDGRGELPAEGGPAATPGAAAEPPASAVDDGPTEG